MARTVIVIRRPRRRGVEVSEYERHWMRPSTSMPIPTYWPASWSNDQPQPGLMTRVEASSVSWTTSSSRPRSSRADHSGLTSLR